MTDEIEVIDLLSDSSLSCHEADDANSVISISSSSSISIANDKSSKRDAPLSSGCPGRKRSPQNRPLESNEPKSKIRRRNRSRRRTSTRYNNVERAYTSHHVFHDRERIHAYYERKRPVEIFNAFREGRRLALQSTEIRNEFEFNGDWWDISSHFSEGEEERSKPPLLEQQCSVIPESVMVTSDNEYTVSSGVTLEPALSDSEVEIISISSSVECPTCERHSLHLGQIERLLGNAKAIPACCKDESFIIAFIDKIKALLGDLEKDADSGISIFYHECSGSEQFNSILTTAKLIQIFDGLCQVCVIAMKPETRWKNVIRELFKKSGKEIGVILRILHLATYELIVSRGNDRHDLDDVLAVSYGLQMIKTMMMNIYSDSRSELQDTYSTLFLDRPLECHKRCIKRNCRVDKRKVTTCQSCGLRFHKSCFACEEDNEEVVFDDKCCPACRGAASLLKASREGNLVDIYSLLVEKGASPFQAVKETGGSFETALHAAVDCNNYNLMSMLLFGTYLMLNCDISLKEWHFPAIAWGRDSRRHTPFEKGIHICEHIMNATPPTEILLLLKNRGFGPGLPQITRAIQKRDKMLQVLYEMKESELLHSDASMGMEAVPVRVCESASLKKNFFYVSRSIESRETAIRWFDCRSGEKKCLSTFQGDCTEDNRKKLHRDQNLPPSWRAYCNYLCSSSKPCSCHIEGLRFGLEIFETNDRGLGLRTAKGVSIKKDDVICNYVGEIVTALEAKRRDEEYAIAGEIGSYTFNLDEKGDVCIDATKMRSAAAFINHSCAESNTCLFRALGHHLDEKFPYLVFCAKQDIGELQELTFNYGQKPTALCSDCNRMHCLCRQCTELEHRKHGLMV